MAYLKLTSNLTQGDPVLDHQIRTTHEGQAYWANSGPFGEVCGECAFLGYFRQQLTKAGELIKTTHCGGCQKFHEFTGKHGPSVPKRAAACRYFERRENDNG
jgi:hypothetical protein